MFTRETLSPMETGGTNSVWSYRTEDTSIAVLAGGYFNDAADVFEKGTAILVISVYGTFLTYISHIDNGYVRTQVRTSPTLQGDIASQNEITVTEIEAILLSYGVELPLDQSIQMTFQDPTDHPSKAFFCTYDVNDETWFFEKLDPCPA